MPDASWTKLGRKLREIRQRIVASGQPLLGWDETDDVPDSLIDEISEIDEWDGKSYAEFEPHREFCGWRTRAIMAERELKRLHPELFKRR